MELSRYYVSCVGLLCITYYDKAVKCPPILLRVEGVREFDEFLTRLIK